MKRIHPVILAAVLLLASVPLLPAAAMAQDQGQGDDSDVYKRDEETLNRAETLTREARGAQNETLADKTLTYDPEGRRDPFRPLVGGAPTEEGERGQLPGISGLLFSEVQLVGIVQGEDGKPIAVFFGGPDERGYFVREGMNFWNGSVHSINPVTMSVVIRQRSEDSIKPYKDIDILLYPNEEKQ